MGAARVIPVREWLRTPLARAIDRVAVERLEAAVLDDAAEEARLVRLPHGTTTGFVTIAGGLRRVLDFDRHGTLLDGLRWQPDGTLAAAWVRGSDHSWFRVEPRATADAPWGLSDRLWHARAPSFAGPVDEKPLTLFESLDWAHVDTIPTMLDPTVVPPGGGTAVLNLMSALAADAGRAPLAYRGPYPTEQLFLALLESFRYVAPADTPDPLAAFMHGRLAWMPAPHERVFYGRDLYVQIRERIEKVTWKGRSYYRPDWQGVERHTFRRVREDADGVHCSLWALGSLVEDHLRLGPGDEVVVTLEPAPTSGDQASLPPEVVDGAVEVVAATSVPALGPLVRAVGSDLTLAWGQVPGDLVAITGDRATLSGRLREVLERRLAAAPSPSSRAEVALAALMEIAHLLGDTLRARAQARLAALPADAQARALAAPHVEDSGPAARRIAGAVAALLRSWRG